MSSPAAAPHRHSPSAAAFTSVSSAIGTSSPEWSAATRSVSAQPGLGVVVIVPHVGEAGRMSTGPNAPTPRAPTGPFSVKNRMARRTVSCGAVVGNVSVLSSSPREVGDRADPLGAPRLDTSVPHQPTSPRGQMTIAHDSWATIRQPHDR